MKFGLGQSALREEDQRFLRGRGRYTDDINLPGQAILTVTDTQTGSLQPGQWYELIIAGSAAEILQETTLYLLVGGSQNFLPLASK